MWLLADFTKLPTKLKKFIASGNVPYVPTSSVSGVDDIKKESYRVLVRSLKQPIKTDRGKKINIGMYNKEMYGIPNNTELTRTIKASKSYITPPVIARTDNGFLQLDGGQPLYSVELTPKQAYKIGKQTKRLEKRALGIGLQHKDLHSGNIVVNKKRNKVNFIDWDEQGLLVSAHLHNKSRKTTDYLQRGYNT